MLQIHKDIFGSWDRLAPSRGVTIAMNKPRESRGAEALS